MGHLIFVEKMAKYCKDAHSFRWLVSVRIKLGQSFALTQTF